MIALGVNAERFVHRGLVSAPGTLGFRAKPVQNTGVNPYRDPGLARVRDDGPAHALRKIILRQQICPYPVRLRWFLTFVGHSTVFARAELLFAQILFVALQRPMDRCTQQPKLAGWNPCLSQQISVHRIDRRLSQLRGRRRARVPRQQTQPRAFGNCRLPSADPMRSVCTLYIHGMLRSTTTCVNAAPKRGSARRCRSKSLPILIARVLRFKDSEWQKRRDGVVRHVDGLTDVQVDRDARDAVGLIAREAVRVLDVAYHAEQRAARGLD